MEERTLFDLISEIFQKANVSAILIGGFAVNYHQFSRTTGDIDFLMTEEDFEKTQPLFKEAGCEEVSRNKLFVTLKSRIPPLMYIDILISDLWTGKH